jgi:hypothetical protein
MANPEYLGLFYSTETSVEYVRDLHDGAATDEVRMLMIVFAFNEVKWVSYKDEVLEFAHANWTRWKEEKPAWLTEEIIQRAPDEFIRRMT